MKESQQKILQYAKENYIDGLEHQDKLNNHITIPIGILSVLIGSLSYPFIEDPKWFSNWVFILFFIVYCISIIIIGITLYKVVRHQIGMTYAYVVPPNKLQDFYEDTVDANKHLTDEDLKEAHLVKELNTLLLDHYLKASETNNSNNKKKIKYYREIKIFTVVCTLLIVLSYFLFYFVEKDSSPDYVFIMNQPTEIKKEGGEMSDDQISDTIVNSDNSSLDTPSVNINQPVSVNRPNLEYMQESLDPLNIEKKE